MLASFFMLAAGVFLFNRWTAGVSSGLSPTIVSEPALSEGFPLDVKSQLESEQEKLSSASAVSSPFVSVTDSFQSLVKLVKSPLPANGLENISGVKRNLDHLASSLNGILGRAWNYVRGTLY